VAKQAKEQKEPKTGKPKNTSGIFGGDTVLGDENNDGNMVTRAVKKFTSKESGEHARQRSLARGAQRGTFFGLEKLFD
jgi:hypothetical protein